MLLIKIGGSVITHKDNPFTPNLKNLYGISRAIANYYSKNPEKQLCIVHGGGSFAHVVASRYATKLSLTLQNRRAISLITWSARKLNDRVIESLIDYNLPVFPLQTSSVFMITNKKPKMESNLIETILNNGWIPVLYGDIIIGSREAQVMSGERILESLTAHLIVERIIVCTDVPGILIDVDHPEKGIIEVINPQNIKSVMKVLRTSSSIDVTGGMKEKVRYLYKIAIKQKVQSQ